MPSEAPADYAKLLFRTEPFSKMASAKRFQLLSQARSVRFSEGTSIYPGGQPPTEIFLLLEGRVRITAEMPGIEEPVLIAEYGPGSCVGWDIYLADVCGVEVSADGGAAAGLFVKGPAFFEIARFDTALKESVLNRPTKGEVWWAVLGELQRRNQPLAKAAAVVEHIHQICTTRDWPEEEHAIETKDNYRWVVTGGEGATPGEVWDHPDGVLWARLTGVPIEPFDRALAGLASAPTPKPTPPRSAPAKAEAPAQEKPPEPTIETTPAKEKSPAPSKSPARKINVWKAIRTLAFTVLILAVMAAAVAGWAARQPVIEAVTAGGKLIFRGDTHELNATVGGKVTESHIKPGQRVTRGSVLAIIQPPVDESKARNLADTLARTNAQVEFCEKLFAGLPIKATDAPEAIAAAVREYLLLKSDFRIQSAIAANRPSDPSLTADERTKVIAHFEGEKAERTARVSAASDEAEIKREDLREAEEALREAQAELRLQQDAVSSLISERGDEAKIEAASAQRALAAYRRAVASRQDAVIRIKKEIASIRVAPATATALGAVVASSHIEQIATDIREREKQLRRFSASMRILAVETEIALEQFRADSAPRQIATLYPGIVIEAVNLQPEAPVTPGTVLGKLVTRQAWEVECTIDSVRHIKVGQEFTIVLNDGGKTGKVATRLERTVAAHSNENIRLVCSATRDEWRDGTAVGIEATVVTGNLLERWLKQVGTIGM